MIRAVDPQAKLGLLSARCWTVPLHSIRRRQGRRIPLPPPEDSAAEDEADLAAHSKSVLVGSPETLAARLDALLEETGTDELLLQVTFR